MATIHLTIPESQVIDLVQQLSPEGKRLVFQSLIPELSALDCLVDYGNARMQTLCTERGIPWNDLNEEERQRLVDTWLHEP